jgi:CRP-like cAMP-binding protein
MIGKDELLEVPAFAGLPDDQLQWFLSEAEEYHFKTGDPILVGGEPADAMFVLLEGQLQARGEFAGETITITVPAGQVTGRLPYSRMKTFTFSVRALTDVRVLRFPATKYHDLIQKMPELTERLVGMMTDRVR